MTRKDYELIAHAFARELQFYGEVITPQEKSIVRGVAQRLADKLLQDNPRFDRVKFLRACGFKVSD